MEPYHLYSVNELLALADNPNRWIVPNLIPCPGRGVIYGVGGEYKCRAADQRIQVSSGAWVPISEAEGVQSLRVYNDRTRAIEHAPALVQPNAVAPLVEVTAWSGRVHKLTPNEPVLTQHGWVQAGELSQEHFMRLPLEVECSPSVMLYDSEAYAIGALTGDGGCTGTSPIFTCSEAQALAGMRVALRSLGFTLKPAGESYGYRVVYGFQEVLDRWGLKGKSSKTKRVCPEIFGGSTGEIASFLGGYWDADGSFSWTRECRQVFFTSVNEKLLDDVQLLLLRLGCTSELRRLIGEYKGEPYTWWRLTLEGSSAARFLGLADVRSEKGDRAKALCNARRGGSYEALQERVPADVATRCLEGIGSKFLKRHSGFPKSPPGHYTTWARKKVEAFAFCLERFAETSRDKWPRVHSPTMRELAPKEIWKRAQQLKSLVDPRFAWDQVQSVQERVPEQTWSVTCPSHKTYLCEGAVTHNSTFAYDLGVAMASAGALLEEWPIMKSGPAIVLSTEGDIYSNRDRLMMHMRIRNLHPAETPLFFGQEAIDIGNPAGVKLLESMLEELKPRLVVLDPWASFYSGDENNVSEVKNFLRPLDRLIRKYEFTCIVVHHANKKKEMRGSTGLQAWADFILRFEKTAKVSLASMPNPVDIVTILNTKQRNKADGARWVVVPLIDESVGMIRFGIYDDVDAKRVADAYFKNEVYKVLRSLNTPASENQLREMLGIGQRRVKAAVKSLSEAGLIYQESTARSTGGGRVRSDVVGWEAVKIARVDMVKAILANKKPQPACFGYASDDPDNSGFCLPGIPARPGVPNLRAIRGGKAA